MALKVPDYPLLTLKKKSPDEGNDLPSIPLHWTSLGKVGNWCFPPPPKVAANERGARSAIKPDESASRICGRGENLNQSENGL